MKQLKRYVKNKSVVIGFTIISLVILAAIFAPYLTPYDPTEMDMSKRLISPNSEHLLGTDEFGRDLLTRLLYGARVSLFVGFISVSVAMTIGVLLGLISGYYGKWVDTIIMRIVDIFLSFPVILLAIALVAALGPGLGNVVIALGLVYWTNYARVVRSTVLAVKEEEYVQAAITMGASNLRIIFKYILPNVTAPIIVVATLGLGVAIVAEATLSFLGLGIQPPEPSWGWTLSVGLDFIRNAPYLSVFPGIAIMITVLGFNLLGDGLRDITDPKLNK
ncbi:peptide ABC transporter permease [Compostibacillus humi]|uniref:Peptide ABC transporter permease n=1 Tax=Compostibacillus humi TaxID=1245525 RepID=A0A8J2TQB6_9BACI|nr:nickel transporter permease [Compostibacillus humi]GFZ82153.1 peptide ABC transporter permease [Compostibacillus humi]